MTLEGMLSVRAGQRQFCPSTGIAVAVNYLIAALVLALQQAIERNQDYAPEFRIVWPDGEVRWIKGHARVLRDKAGQPIRMIGTNWDISEIKRRERNLACGFPVALGWLAEQMRQRGLTITVKMVSDWPPISEKHAMLLFQSVRELISNLAKHGRTQRATVTVDTANGMLSIEVPDHGVGFDSLATDEKVQTSPSFGLFSIRERMMALGGNFVLLSASG